MTTVSTRFRIVGSVQLRSDQSVMLVSMLEQILYNQIQTEGGRVSSPGAEVGRIASNAFETVRELMLWWCTIVREESLLQHLCLVFETDGSVDSCK